MTLTAEQLETRREGLGGSDAGAAIGLNPYRTPVEVWLEKTGREQPKDLSDIQAVHFGNVLEGVVAKEYERRTGHRVARVNRTLVHKEHPYLLAHIDRRVVGQRKVLEIKTAGHYASFRWGPEGSDEIPDEYIAQVYHYMAVTGYQAADVAVLIGGQDFRIYHIERDEELMRSIIAAERAFWENHVAADVPPPPSTATDLASLYPEDDGSSLLATPEMAATVAELKALRGQIKALTSEKERLENLIKAGIGDHACLVDESNTPIVTWKAQKSRRLDTKALRSDMPEIAEQFTKTTTTRVLRIK